jgi:LmbE family N-acetylglucosaminyl deacetylase
MDNHNLTPEPDFELPFRILVIGAHHDDLEFGSGGSVAKWIKQGAQVTYCVVTDGGAGSNDPDTDLDKLIEQRKAEQLNAAKTVGVTDVRFLGYRDGALQPTLELRRDLTRVIREVKPDRVVCQDPTAVFVGDGYINHPDHRAAGEAAVYATFPSAESRPIFPELLDEGYEPHKVYELYLNIAPNPNLFVDISDTLDTKLDALRCHVSQLGTGDDFENGVAKWVRGRAQEGGKEVGVGAVEVFHVMRLRQREEAAKAAKAAASSNGKGQQDELAASREQ